MGFSVIPAIATKTLLAQGVHEGAADIGEGLFDRIHCGAWHRDRSLGEMRRILRIKSECPPSHQFRFYTDLTVRGMSALQRLRGRPCTVPTAVGEAG